MRSIRYAVLACLVCSAAFAGGSHHVRSYTKKDGTVVESHQQTNPNKTKDDNYSTKGNYNPNTGKEGTKDPER